jgi:hypothetical protein
VDEVGGVPAELLTEKAQIRPEAPGGEDPHLCAGRKEGRVFGRQRAVEVEEEIKVFKALSRAFAEALDEAADIRTKAAVLRV